MTLPYTRNLIIPDVHHDLDWVNAILSKEDGQYDGITFLGDYFDSPKPKYSGKNVAKFIVSLKERLGDQVTYLIGNHDLQYLILAGAARNFRAITSREIHKQWYSATGYSRSRAEDLSRYLPDDFIFQHMKIAVLNNGYLLSHAGVLPVFLVDGIETFFDTCDTAVKHMRTGGPHPLFFCSNVRSGTDPFSGPLWLDFEQEFVDALEYPQVVGHTSRPLDSKVKGRSVCIDNEQTTYGILSPTGLDIKSI